MKTSFAVMITAISISGLAAFAFTTADFSQDNQLKSTAAMLGHITLIAYDSEGNVKNYVQTDNVVVNEADDCIMEAFFQPSGVTACQNPNTIFDHIAIGTGNTAFSEDGDLSDLTWHSQTTGSVSAGTAASGNSGASAVVSATFNDVSATITEAALHNNPTTASADTMAIQDFNDIALGSTDDLTIQWTITVDGS
ncbi:hypothetical protein [Nitrosopumilus sp. S6]